MPKYPLFNITNPEYVFAVGHAQEVLKEMGTPIMVGGGAIQMYLGAWHSKKHDLPIEDLVERSIMSEREGLRRTDDIDMICLTDLSAQSILPILDKMKGIFQTENGLYEVSFIRRGSYRPMFSVEGLEGSIDVKYNLMTKPEHLKALSKGCEAANTHYREVTIRNQDGETKILVQDPELLIAAKLPRWAKRDIFDCINIIQTAREVGEDISEEKIIENISPNLIPRYNKLANLVDWDPFYEEE